MELAGLGTAVPLLRRSPENLFAAYSALSRKAGIRDFYFVLSFDCDTPEDADAALELHPALTAKGIEPCYAVPGTELERSAEKYARLAGQGAVFLNHGYRPHAAREDGRYVSITFYDRLSADEVVEDIRSGHAAVKAVTGRDAVGFRAPHFGHFQGHAQRRLVYRTVAELGYAFSSDTLPISGLKHGPIYDTGNGVLEIPLSGMMARPATILDSWSLWDQETNELSNVYFERFRETVDFFTERNLPGVFNHYVDPAHVAGQPAFEKAIDHLLARGVKSVGLWQLPGLIAQS